MQWIVENGGTVIVTLVMIAIAAAIIVTMRKDKKKGKSSCGYNCGCCPMAGTCHKTADTEGK